jgi:hypothetical protein
LEGTNVKSVGCFLVCLVLAACAVSSAQDRTERLSILQPEIQQAEVAAPPSCSEQTQVIRVPPAIAKRAKVKARLLNLLHASLLDDAKGLVNAAQEKEIRKLANEIRKEDPQQY